MRAPFILIFVVELLCGCRKELPAPPSYLRLVIDGQSVVCDRDIKAMTNNGHSLGFYGYWQGGSVEVKLLDLQEKTGTQPLSALNSIVLYYDGMYASWGGIVAGSDTGRIIIRTIDDKRVQGTFTGRVVNMFGWPHLITNGEFAINRGP